MSATIRATLWRINFTGVLPRGEIFDHGLWATHDVSSLGADVAAAWSVGLTAMLNAAAGGVGGGHFFDYLGAGVDYNAVSARPYNAATGAPLGDNTPVPFDSTALRGGSNALPLQCACVATFWNGLTIGRHRYNRTYLPPFSTAAMGADGRLNLVAGADVTSAIAAMDAAVGASATPGGVNVYSQVIHTVTGASFVRCDDIIDTQRRRRDQLTSTFTTLALP